MPLNGASQLTGFKARRSASVPGKAVAEACRSRQRVRGMNAPAPSDCNRFAEDSQSKLVFALNHAGKT